MATFHERAVYEESDGWDPINLAAYCYHHVLQCGHTVRATQAFCARNCLSGAAKRPPRRMKAFDCRECSSTGESGPDDDSDELRPSGPGYKHLILGMKIEDSTACSQTTSALYYLRGGQVTRSVTVKQNPIVEYPQEQETLQHDEAPANNMSMTLSLRPHVRQMPTATSRPTASPSSEVTSMRPEGLSTGEGQDTIVDYQQFLEIGKTRVETSVRTWQAFGEHNEIEKVTHHFNHLTTDLMDLSSNTDLPATSRENTGPPPPQKASGKTSSHTSLSTPITSTRQSGVSRKAYRVQKNKPSKTTDLSTDLTKVRDTTRLRSLAREDGSKSSGLAGHMKWDDSKELHSSMWQRSTFESMEELHLPYPPDGYRVASRHPDETLSYEQVNDDFKKMKLTTRDVGRKVDGSLERMFAHQEEMEMSWDMDGMNIEVSDESDIL